MCSYFIHSPYHIHLHTSLLASCIAAVHPITSAAVRAVEVLWKQFNQAVLHFDLHAQMTRSRHAPEIGGSLVQTAFKQSVSIVHVEVSVREGMTMYMHLVCRQPDLCLVVGACGLNSRASLVGGVMTRLCLTEDLEYGIVDSSGVSYRRHTNCCVTSEVICHIVREHINIVCMVTSMAAL